MKIIKASSHEETSGKAVEEIKAAFKGSTPKMVLFFASSKYAPQSISSEMEAAFPESTVIGCSTDGEIVSGEMLKGSVVAMAFSSEVLEDVRVEVLENIKKDVNVSDAFKGFERYYHEKMEGMELSLLESADIVEQTAKALEEKVAEFGEISGLANFNCILRTLDLEGKGLGKDYAALFKDIPTIGFSTYGEQYLGHINQTATIIAFR